MQIITFFICLNHTSQFAPAVVQVGGNTLTSAKGGDTLLSSNTVWDYGPSLLRITSSLSYDEYP